MELKKRCPETDQICDFHPRIYEMFSAEVQCSFPIEERSVEALKRICSSSSGSQTLCALLCLQAERRSLLPLFRSLIVIITPDFFFFSKQSALKVIYLKAFPHFSCHFQHFTAALHITSSQLLISFTLRLCLQT